MSKSLVLASASPRRRELLEQIGLEFTVVASHVVESDYDSSSPDQLVVELAQAKARWVASSYDDAVVIGADTVVVVEGQVLGKPAHEAEAACMLRRLRGRVHRVYTGVALIDILKKREANGYEITRVFMRNYDDHELNRYVATGEPADKAGGYAIQGLGALLVAGIDGCYTNVVGLPLALLGQMLKEFDVPIL